MQIPPSSSLLSALSRSADPATAPRPSSANADAARAAARAVFAQLKAPVAAPAPQGGFAPALAAASAPQNFSPAIPATQPDRPLPRGSLLNILV